VELLQPLELAELEDCTEAQVLAEVVLEMDLTAERVVTEVAV
jgi:hypothetical protein